MTLLLTTDRTRFADYTKELLPLSAAATRAVRSAVEGAEPPIADAVGGDIVRYLDYARWPVRRLEYSFVLRALACLRSRRPVERVLDVGCGPSVFPAILASAFRCPVCCVDREPPVVEAMGRLGLPRCTYSFADMTAFPFEDRSFDAVTCVSVLEHVHRETGLRAISEMLRVTRDDGLVVLTVDYRSLAGGTGLRKLLARVGKAAAYLARGKPAALMRAAASPKPYDRRDVRQIASAFDEAAGEPPGRSWGRVGSAEIARFWWAHREPGLVNDPGQRDYASVGILLSRDSGVRSLLAGCEGLAP